MWSTHIASNMNFPAPLAVVGFLGAAGGFFLTLGSAFIFWFARKPRFARIALVTLGSGTAVYLTLLLAFSVSSREIALPRGQEKYFCEIDCHLAYSIADVQAVSGEGTKDYTITLRTRFDETTTSPNRPKNASLTPSPREVVLLDEEGRIYEPISSSGHPFMTPLRPAESYTTEVGFRVPLDARGLRLLINTSPAWPDHVVIGDENSWLHKKTYFAL